MVYIAFDAGNLPHVAPYLHELYPNKDMIICADNDHATEQDTGKNPGLIYAKQAARVSGADLEYPIFEGDNAEQYSDWNDYYQLKKQLGQL